MKYCIIVTSDTGKTIKIAGNEYIDIDVMHKNTRIAALTMREDGETGEPAVFNENDDDISTATGT